MSEMMISCSHWGMFAGYRYIGAYQGCGIRECDMLEYENSRPGQISWIDDTLPGIYWANREAALVRLREWFEGSK